MTEKTGSAGIVIQRFDLKGLVYYEAELRRYGVVGCATGNSPEFALDALRRKIKDDPFWEANND